MKHLNFCTYFDLNYLPYAKLLNKSLLEQKMDFTLFIVCMDYEVFNYLKKDPFLNSVVYSHEELLIFRPELKLINKKRTKSEYFFTCSAQVCDFIFEQNPTIELLNYIDADLYFFNPLKALFDELGDASIGVVEHKFHWTNRSKNKYGRFNVGWISFRNDDDGRKCVTEWSQQCIDWCYQKLDNGKYADQKYLDYWPKKYNNLKILKHKGANIAIWNIKNYILRREKGRIYVDDQPLLFYHFAGLKQIDSYTFKTNLSSYLVSLKGVLLNDIYKPYLYELSKITSKHNVKFIKDIKHTNLVSLIRDWVNRVKFFAYRDIISVKKS
tara:strand:+ start:968 stop:1942 length:975 start_codon:yes stop_codon:yes gene_type:complete